MTRGRKFLVLLLPVGAAALLFWMATWETPSGADTAGLPHSRSLSGPDRDSGRESAGSTSPGLEVDAPRRESAPDGRPGAPHAAGGGGCALAGTVRDQQGHTLAGVTVALLRARIGLIGLRQPLGIETRTSGTGEFLFERLQCGVLLSLECRAPGKALLQHGPVRLRAGEITRVPGLRLLAGLTLTGQIRSGLDLTPLAGATVMAERVDRPEGLMSTPGSAALTDTTDRQGRYDISGVGHTQYRIRVEASGFAPRSVQRSFLASRHLDRIELSFQLEPAAETALGEVKDSRGRPIAGATIVARPAAGDAGHLVRATADETGSFRLTGLSRTEYHLRASASGHSQLEPLTWRPGQDRITLELVKNGALRGRVLAADGGTPRRLGVEVVRLGPDERRSLVKRARLAGDAGQFLAGDLSPGVYHLWVSADNSSSTLSAAFEIRAGETLEGLSVRMSAGGSITGTILDGDGQPLRGAEALLMPFDLDPEQERAESLLRMPLFGKRSRSDATGHFRLAHVPPGEYQLRLLGGGGALLVAQVRVREDAATELGPIRIERGGVLEGTALGRDGKALPNHRIVLISKQAGYRASLMTDGQGRFSMSSLPAGSYRVSICLPEGTDPYAPYAPYAQEHEISARVEQDATTTVTVRIRQRP